MDDADTLPLFPLELVLLPGEMAPLHIFEERYKRLMGALRREGGEFGVVLAEEDRIHEAGCSAVLTGVIEEFEDGRLNVLVEGQRRFRVVELHPPADQERDCLRATVSFFDDRDQGSRELREAALAAYAGLLKAMGVEGSQVPRGAAALSFRLAATLDLGSNVKQALLESESEGERLTNLVSVAKTLLPRLDAQRKRADAIRGNGKGM